MATKVVKQKEDSLILKRVKEFLITPKFSIRNVLLSLVLGFVIAYVVLLCVYGGSGANHILSSLFKQDFLDSKTTASLVGKITALGMAGLAVAFGMKAGVLNIGVSGQMTAGAFIGYLLISKNSWMQDTNNNASVLAVSFFIVVAIAVITALLSGVLKAYFKVNEVISTIMINWIVVYFVKRYANNSNKDEFQMNSGDAKNVDVTRFVAGHEWAFAAIGIALFVVCAIAAWLFLAKTKGGFKTIAAGQSLNAATYSGYNSKLLLINAFAISGLFAGIGAFILFFLSYNSIPGAEAPIAEGFTGIAVALVAMLNPLAVIPSAILFGILSGPVNGIIVAGFAPDVVTIFSGVITYFVAVSGLFIYIKPIAHFKRVKANYVARKAAK